MTLHVRALTDEERSKLERLTRARTAPVRLASRARVIQLTAAGLTAPAAAGRLGVSEKCVRLWMKRFNQDGLDGLEDAPRSGRPRAYPEDARSQVIAKARSRPPVATITTTSGEQEAKAAAAPTCHWTLDRLQAELTKDGVLIKRSQIRRILREEHVKWQQPRTWLESNDPDFAAKRGRSFSSTATRLPTAP